MTDKALVKASRFIALVLRHKPDAAGVALDEQGWAAVAPLLAGMAANGHGISADDLAAIVATDEKGRYEFSADGLRIRARQGHSIAVDSGLEAADPPPMLYHGTAARSLAAILDEGLRRMARHHVHLSADAVTARAVGARHGAPVVLRVDAAGMARDGHRFHRSSNGVWLADAVPPAYLAPLPD